MSDTAYPPPSSDESTQDFIDTAYREAVDYADKGREACRRIWPNTTAIMTETGGQHMREALDRFEAALRSLELAGRHVIGEAAYVELVEDRLHRQTRPSDPA